MNHIYISDKKYIKPIISILESAGVVVTSQADFGMDRPLTDTCSSWYTILKDFGVEDWLTEGAIELKPNKWYKLKQAGNCVVKYNGNDLGTGFTIEGLWSSSITMNTPSKWVEATPDEIEHMLRKEACKRYDETDRKLIDSGCDKNPWNWTYHRLGDSLYTRQYGVGGEVVYANGAWAETEFRVKDFEVSLTKDQDLIIGCTSIDKSLLTEDVFDVVEMAIRHDFNLKDVGAIKEYLKGKDAIRTF